MGSKKKSKKMKSPKRYFRKLVFEDSMSVSNWPVFVQKGIAVSGIHELHELVEGFDVSEYTESRFEGSNYFGIRRAYVFGNSEGFEDCAGIVNSVLVTRNPEGCEGSKIYQTKLYLNKSREPPGDLREMIEGIYFRYGQNPGVNEFLI